MSEIRQNKIKRSETFSAESTLSKYYVDLQVQ